MRNFFTWFRVVLESFQTSGPTTTGGTERVIVPPLPPNFLYKKKRETNAKNVTTLAILERLEFKIFLVGQPWWPTILFSVPWPLHFEIHFAGSGHALDIKFY